MKKLLFIFIIVIISVSCHKFKSISEAGIEVASEIDLDTIKKNVVTNAELIIKNIGEKDLIIKDIQSSCDCTVVDKWDSIIKKDESTTINFEIHPTKLGDFQKNVVIRSNVKDEFSSVSIIGYVIE